MRVQTLVNDGAGWSAALPHADSTSTLVLVFGARRRDADQSWLEDLRRTYPSSCMLGCSTSGEIVGEQLLDDTIGVAVVEFERSSIRMATVCTSDAIDSEAAGLELGRQLAADDLASVLVFADGLSTNGSALVAGLQKGAGQTTPVSGGLAGDGDRFERTWVLSNDQFGPGLITSVGLYGDAVETNYGSRGGWIPFGPERIVTGSEASVLHELDGQPALPLYQSYLGELADGLPASALFFPLCIWPADRPADRLVRTILGVDAETGSMTFAGDIPQGWRAQLMMSNPDDLIDAAADAAGDATHDGGSTAGVSPLGVDAGGQPNHALALAVSCVGRRLVLGSAAEDELMAVTDGLGDGTPVIGFYSYGEISTAEGVGELHNQTMTITTLREAER